MNILITGGAGMIGANLSPALIAQGHTVTVIDDLSSGKMFNISQDCEFIQGDISDKETILKLFKENQFEIIIHLAALFANQNSVEHPQKDLTVNGMGTLMLLEEALKQYQIGKLRRFLYASSSCVYGMFNGIVSEDATKNLETPYAITKLLGEHYTNYFRDMFGLPTTIFRFFNAYGPGELPGKYRNVIPNFVNLAFQNKPLTITGTGNETRDFTFIKDTIYGILLGISEENALGKTFNVSTGRETKIIDLAKSIIEKTKSKSEIVYVPRRNWDHTLRRCGSIDLISKELGYAPKYSLDEGLEQTVYWLSKNIQSV